MAPKRKSDAEATAATKKARLEDEMETGRKLVEDVLGTSSALASDDMLALAKYARLLEEDLAKYQPKKKDIRAAAYAIRETMVREIVRNMNWDPWCKARKAKIVYEGVCLDPEVFAFLFKIPGPPKCKTHKYTVEEFHKLIGTEIKRSVRYDNLLLFGEVKLRYQPTAGTFKISGTYGK